MKQYPEHTLIVMPKNPAKTVRGLEKWHVRLFEDSIRFEESPSTVWPCLPENSR